MKFLLACQAGFFLVMAGASVSAHAEQQAQACPVLLMDAECAQYHQRLNLASSEEQRSRIITEYAQLLNERRHACPVSDKLGQQAARFRSALR